MRDLEISTTAETCMAVGKLKFAKMDMRNSVECDFSEVVNSRVVGRLGHVDVVVGVNRLL